MGARTWRTTTTCAALLLTATGCVVGPTIDDEKPKTPAAATVGVPTVPEGGNAPPRNATGGPWAGNPSVPGAPATAPAASASPTRPAYVIGGGTAFTFADGTRVDVLEARVDPSLGASAKGLLPVVVRTQVTNGTTGPLWAYRIDLKLRACGQPPAQCLGIDTPTKEAEAAKTLAPGDSQEVSWFFGASADKAGAPVTVVVSDPKSGRAEFNGSLK